MGIQDVLLIRRYTGNVAPARREAAGLLMGVIVDFSGILLRKRTVLVISLSLMISILCLTTHASLAEVITLSKGLQLVTEQSRILKITQREEAISEADVMHARARLFPEVNAAAGYTTQAYQPQAIFGSLTVPVSEKNFLSYSISIQQTLFDFQKDSSAFKSSKAILNSKKIDIERVKNLVALDFLIIYFDLLEAEKMVLVSEQEVERLVSHLGDAEHLFEEGVITKNDLLQAEVQISDAKQRLLSAQNLRALTTSRLNSALSRALTHDVTVADVDVSTVNLETLNKEKAWEMAEQQRPEIMIIDETLKALDFEKTAKQSDYFPHFYAKGGYDYTENEFMVHEDNWYLLFGLSMNLFQGGATRAEILKIENQKMKLIEQTYKLLDDIKLEVERSLLEMRNANERIAVTKDAINQAEENLRINKLKYEEGVGTATDVIDAVTLLTMANTNYYKASYDLRRAEGAFLYSTGTNLVEAYQ